MSPGLHVLKGAKTAHTNQGTGRVSTPEDCAHAAHLIVNFLNNHPEVPAALEQELTEHMGAWMYTMDNYSDIQFLDELNTVTRQLVGAPPLGE